MNLPPSAPLAFLGPIGGPEMIILFFLFVGAIIAVIVMASRKSTRTDQPPLPQGHAVADTEGRLRELDGLKAKGLISEAEHAEKRRQIINGI